MDRVEVSEVQDAAIRLWNQGMGLREVGAAIGYSHEAVRQMLIKAGIDTHIKYPRRNPPVSVRNCRICGVKIPWPRKSLCLEHARAVKKNNYKYAIPEAQEQMRARMRQCKQKARGFKEGEHEH